MTKSEWRAVFARMAEHIGPAFSGDSAVFDGFDDRLSTFTVTEILATDWELLTHQPE